MTFDDIGALIGALLVVTYHYGITRDVRRTLHRIADALESHLEPSAGEED